MRSGPSGQRTGRFGGHAAHRADSRPPDGGLAFPVLPVHTIGSGPSGRPAGRFGGDAAHHRMALVSRRYIQ